MKKEIFIGIMIGLVTAFVVEAAKEIYMKKHVEKDRKENYCNLLNSINDDLEIKLIGFKGMSDYLENYKEPDYFTAKLELSTNFIDYAIVELTNYNYD